MEEFTAIFKARDVLKETLDNKRFEVRESDMSPVLGIVDLICEEEHINFNKLYTVGFFDDTYKLVFQSNLDYFDTVTDQHKLEIEEAGFEFEIRDCMLTLKKEDSSLEDLAKDVEFAAEFLLPFD